VGAQPGALLAYLALEPDGCGQQQGEAELACLKPPLRVGYRRRKLVIQREHSGFLLSK